MGGFILTPTGVFVNRTGRRLVAEHTVASEAQPDEQPAQPEATTTTAPKWFHFRGRVLLVIPAAAAASWATGFSDATAVTNTTVPINIWLRLTRTGSD